MLLVSEGRGQEEARQYFFTKYLVPLALTYWYQKDDRGAGDMCRVWIAATLGGAEPIIQFGQSRIDGKVRVALQDQALTALKREVFRACPPSLWAEKGASLGEAVHSAFKDCFPDSTVIAENIFGCPLVASMAVKSDRNSESVELTVLVKTKNSVKNNEALLNQADSLNSPMLIRPSEKYGKMYNVITGNWVGVCDRTDPEKCTQCAVIYSSPSAENVYNDPDFR
jgi:hypothetical protein